MRAKFMDQLEILATPKNKLVSLLTYLVPFGNKLKNHLPQEVARLFYDLKLYASPRMVELPFVLANLDIENGRILDAGCVWSRLPLEMASLGHKVWGADLRDYEYSHPNFTFVKTDLCRTPFENDFFDRITCVSVIEHIGIGYYGDPVGEALDRKAVEEFHRILKPGGKLILTTHYGIFEDGHPIKVYNRRMLDKLIEGFKIDKLRFFSKKDNSWNVCSREEADDLGKDEERNWPNGLVCLVAEKQT
jgi:SAM-dependent methyltransferase